MKQNDNKKKEKKKTRQKTLSKQFLFKDISSVWSGWVTPGRMLSRVYKNLGKKTNRSRYYVKYRDVTSERDIGQLVFALQGKWMGNNCQYIFKFKELLAIVCNLSPSSGLTLFRIILRETTHQKHQNLAFKFSLHLPLMVSLQHHDFPCLGEKF